MLSSVLSIGLESLDRVAKVAAKRQQQQAPHPLAAYPRLQAMLVEAERSGTLDAERRRLIRNKLAA